MGQQAEIEAKFKEKDDAVKARNQELYEQWQAESLAKQQKQLNHFKKVQENAERHEEAKRERCVGVVFSSWCLLANVVAPRTHP